MSTLRLIVQLALAVLFVVGFFIGLKRAIDGQPAKPAEGFKGVTLLIVITSLVWFAHWTAGTFSAFAGMP